MLFEKKVEDLRKIKYGGRETSKFLLDVVKMAEGEAFEYIMGEIKFSDALVDLTLRPMIPRKETEFWVEQALHAILGSKKYQEIRGERLEEKGDIDFEVLDLFSGSGCVGLASLKNIPFSHVTFIELDAKLKRQIELSAEKNKFATERYEVKTGSVWEGAKEDFYDVIFAVPPYVPASMKEEVMSELHAEPSLAFFDREGGFYFHKQIIEGASKYLKDGGSLFLEFDITQRKGIEELIRNAGYHVYSFLLDPYYHECAVMIEKR